MKHTHEFEVGVTLLDGTTIYYPVEDFLIRRSTLVPVYNSGMTPADEHPMNLVTLNRVRAPRAVVARDR